MLLVEHPLQEARRVGSTNRPLPFGAQGGQIPFGRRGAGRQLPGFVKERRRPGQQQDGFGRRAAVERGAELRQRRQQSGRARQRRARRADQNPVEPFARQSHGIAFQAARLCQWAL